MTTSDHGIRATIPQETLDLAPRAKPRVRMADLERDLRRAVEARRTAEERVTRGVARLREQNVSWTQIAVMLGTSKQAAHQRYGSTTPQ